jgi:hypothetical protein
MLQQILQVEGGATEREVLAVLFNYLFRKIKKYDYRAQLPTRQFAKELWSRVERSGYVLMNCKLYVYARHCAMREGRRISPAAFGIAPEDVRLLNSLDVSHVKRKYKSMNLEQYTRAEKWVFSDPDLDMPTYMGKFISKKMIFLCRHYGVKRDHIEGVLIDAALYAMRKQYPYYESELHMVNVCKTAIHHAGISLIQYWTRGKRNALIREDDGTFSAVHVDIEVAQYMQNIGTLDPQDDEHAQTLQALRACSERMGPRAQSFLSLARGAYDPGFSVFIGLNNEDAAHDWNYQKYLGSICKYLKVNDDQARRFMDFMRSKV